MSWHFYNRDLLSWFRTFGINREWFSQETPYDMQVVTLRHTIERLSISHSSAVYGFGYSHCREQERLGCEKKALGLKRQRSKALGTISDYGKKSDGRNDSERFAWSPANVFKHHQSSVWLCLILSNQQDTPHTTLKHQQNHSNDNT